MSKRRHSTEQIIHETGESGDLTAMGQTAERTRDAMLHHQANGLRMSDRPPYGWMSNPCNSNGLIPNRSEQDAIAIILRLHEPGKSLRAIGRDIARSRYTFAEYAWKPRIGAGFDWASGDRNPTDGTVETFDRLFPLGHKYLGFMDFFGRQNIQAANLNISAWPIPKKVNARLAWLAFWLESEDDAIYNVGARQGVAIRRVAVEMKSGKKSISPFCG